MNVFGCKINNLINFINPGKVIAIGEDYILDDRTWNVMTKRCDERYRIFWKSEDVAKIVVGLIVDDVYKGKDVVMGELYEGDLVIYPRTMEVFSKELSEYLECTPDTDSFADKITETLKLITDEVENSNTKEKGLPSVDFDFFEVE